MIVIMIPREGQRATASWFDAMGTASAWL